MQLFYFLINYTMSSLISNPLEKYYNQNIGLYKGQTGLLLYYSLYKQEANSIITRHLLYNISQKISTISDISFSQGLLGICWGLANINIEIPKSLACFLKDFDDYIYKSIVNYQQIDFSLERGTIGKSLYLYQRLKSQKENIFYRDIALRECLILLIIEIKQYLQNLFSRSIHTPINSQEEKNILYAINLLFNLKDLEMHNLLTDEIMYTTKKFIINHINNNINCSMKSNILLYCIATTSEDNELLKYYNSNHFITFPTEDLRYTLAKLLCNLNLPYWHMF